MRIKAEDIELVRERARIDEIVEKHVTLRNSGAGSRKGLCPFHEEKTPSFQVTPARGLYYCFGCGASGDVFTFLKEIEGLDFVEAVERLASQYGITLRYEDTGKPSGPKRDPKLRSRIIEAHGAAARFYFDALLSAEGQPARDFLKDRGFDKEAAEKFLVGFSPRKGDALVNYLQGLGFTAEEMMAGDLVRRGNTGLYDRFRGRVMWPIRETNGDVIGFGARRLFEDDTNPAKYLNTSETPVYKKSHVLYGLDLARREIASSGQVVIVEGYTDVMACHLAGVTTAVATCGTAFGTEHARVIRRIMSSQDAFHGEVIFTFDGDSAGQSAALKAYEGDSEFAAQTYVVIVPGGMDPCDLRLANGDAAVREMVATRIPLYRFVLHETVKKYDLDRGDQRIDAMREALGLVKAIRDTSKIEEFLREISDNVGVDLDTVRGEYRKTAKATRAKVAPRTEPVESLGGQVYDDEREALKAIAQYPQIARNLIGDIHENDFTHPIALTIWEAMNAVGFPEASDPNWNSRVIETIEDEATKHAFTRACVEEIKFLGEVNAQFVGAILTRLSERTIDRHISDLKSKLQRTNPVDHVEEYNAMFGELIALETKRRELRERRLGE